MKKIVIFDLDGTLCPVGSGITKENIIRINKIRESGMKIAICSGKPVSYLTGICRQTEWEDIILLGENGAVLQFGGSYPPSSSYTLPYPREVKERLRAIREDLESMIPALWFQPNGVAVTPFPKNEQEFDRIQEYLDAHKENLKGIKVFRHIDSFDLLPEGMTKFEGLKMLTDISGILPEEMIAVGDGANDIPMFRYVGLALGIAFGQEEEVDYNFASLAEGLDFIIENIIV